MNDKEILDVSSEPIKSSRYSKLSLAMAVITISSITYFITSSPKIIKASQSLEPPHWSSYALIIGSASLGFVFSILSIYFKEQWTFFKLIGIVINFIIAAIIIIVVYKVNQIIY